MKRTLFTCLVLAAVGICLLVSCAVQNNVPGEGDGIAYIRFGRDDRAFNADYDIQEYDNLYWFYTAQKADSYGKTGETTDEVPVTADKNESGAITTVNKGLSGTIGPFSQGDWKFTLKAYAALSTDNKPDTSKLVYQNVGDITATLRGGETKSIPAEVKPAGDTGSLKFDGAYFKWQDSGSAAPLFKIEAYGIDKKVTYILTNDSSITEGNVSKIVLGDYEEGKGYPIKYVLSETTVTDTISVPVDYYTCKITAYINGDETKPVAEDASFGFRIYGGATTVVSGDLTEKADSYASFDVKKTAIQSFTASSTAETKIEVAVAPKTEAYNSTESDKKTNKSEVAFEAGALTAADATYCLSAETLSAETASDSFTITAEEGSGTVAVYGSIKLTLDAINGTTSTSVTDFGGKTVTVTTYIAPGLESSDVTVKYNGDGAQPTNVTYDSTSGKVTFKTTHFSEFVVVSKKAAPVYNKSQNRYYSTLEDSVKNLGDTTELELKSDVTVSKTVTIKQNLSLDLGGKTITFAVTDTKADGFLLDTSDKAYTVEFKNGKIAGKTTNNGFTVKTNATLILDTVTMDVECLRGVQIYKGSKPAALEIKNKSSITVKDGYYAVATNASDAANTYVSIKIDNSMLKTYSSESRTEYKEETTALLCNVPTTLLISNSTIIGERQGAIIRGADTEHEKKIVDSVIEASSTKTDYSDDLSSGWIDGNGVALAALVIGDNNTGSYPFGTTVELDNVELKIAETTVRKSLYAYQDGENWPVLVTGTVKGDFTINPDTNGAIAFPEAKIGAKYYAKLQEAIDAAQSGETVEVLRDINLDDKFTVAKSAGVVMNFTEEETLTLDGNGHKLYTTKEITYDDSCMIKIEGNNKAVKVTLKDIKVVAEGKINCDQFRLVNIWDIVGTDSTNTGVFFENAELIIQEVKSGSSCRGLSVSDNKNMTVKLDNTTLSIPDYYTINVTKGSEADCNVKLEIVNKSSVSGWSPINNWETGLSVEAEDSTFTSVNNYSGSTDGFACVIVSQEPSSAANSYATMTFKGCTFDVSKIYSDVAQHVFALRNSQKVSSVTLTGCTLNPATTGEYWSITSGAGSITVDGQTYNE